MKRARVAPVWVGGFFAVALSGCQTAAPPAHPPAPVALTPTEQFQIKVASTPERIALAVHPDGLSPNQKAALSGFVSRWRSDGGDTVVVAAGPGVGSVRQALATVSYVAELGVPREQLQMAGAAPGSPIVLSYARFQARGPDCDSPWDDLTATGSNKPYNHFGCAVTANIAAQVANPRDFLAPAVETPADDSRREVVLGKYRLGEPTSTLADKQASGKVSDILQ